MDLVHLKNYPTGGGGSWGQALMQACASLANWASANDSPAAAPATHKAQPTPAVHIKHPAQHIAATTADAAVANSMSVTRVWAQAATQLA